MCTAATASYSGLQRPVISRCTDIAEQCGRWHRWDRSAPCPLPQWERYQGAWQAEVMPLPFRRRPAAASVPITGAQRTPRRSIARSRSFAPLAVLLLRPCMPQGRPRRRR
eukprot:scaffold101431_cov30-Tisochrysis_lutea.AAC.1